MRLTSAFLLTLGLFLTLSQTDAHPPPGKKGGGGPPGSGGKAASVDDMVQRLMAFDANKDGKLTKEELGDERLNALFDRADAQKHGYVTKDELAALLTKEAAAVSTGGGPGGGGPSGGGPPGGRPRPQPGQVLSSGLQDELQLTAVQKKELAQIQKTVDDALGKILTAEQKSQLEGMQRGPGNGGPPPR
ncbi:EF-hand domain-containing protein [Limnoglobus roseus]|uniref:EF-hand domain-containing protein n=1 Tax=Limnoglobus roseus TaxID=2598579 RepID=A0A5C1ALE8_9BACT|nr:hypothetical protein [Limnoglobus roseus]QEL18014.1 EF-hand domain-containing protein [Limnoglobus roseus]